MTKFSEKIYLTLTPPTEEVPLSDREQLLHALSDTGYPEVKILLPALQELHSACLDRKSVV